MRDLRVPFADHGAFAEPPVLIIGWSVLEGVGAALILPAIVALVASNSGDRSGRARTDWLHPPARSPWPRAR